MAFDTAQGHPQYSGNYIPTIFSGKLLVKFYEALVTAAISNTEYEGEIENQGDKVVIRTTPDITIRDYVKGQTLQYESPDSPPVELLIDKGKYFGFTVDDVDKVQSDINLMDDWSNDASMQMKIEVDRGILGDIWGDAAAANRGTSAGAISGSFNLGATSSPVQLTRTNILDYIVDLGTVLDEQNIPDEDRWLVLPAWAVGLLKKSDLKDASLTGDATSVLRNGRVGMIDRFELYKSNLVNSVTDGSFTAYNILAGHKSALTFAAQFTNTETLRAESTFGDLVRGLLVYGYEVVKPDALAVLYARQ